MIYRHGTVRNRWLYLCFIAITIIVGLATRRFGALRPPFIASYAPDALWALMVFWIIGLVGNKLPTVKVMAGALAFSCLIEISQLYQAPWINGLRHTRLGGLILGFGFLWSDIACYTVGVLLGGGIEYLIYRRNNEPFSRSRT